MKRIIAISIAVLCATSLQAQIGRRFPSERKVINDPKTGVELVFLTSKAARATLRSIRPTTSGPQTAVG